ncbi:hypothetical protein V2J09_014533 [Rumex salicifolius]
MTRAWTCFPCSKAARDEHAFRTLAIVTAFGNIPPASIFPYKLRAASLSSFCTKPLIMEVNNTVSELITPTNACSVGQTPEMFSLENRLRAFSGSPLCAKPVTIADQVIEFLSTDISNI